MADYNITLTTEQDAALDVLVPRVNATLPEETKPYTKASYLQQRVSELVENYVAQLLSEETQIITEAYKTADDAKKALIKDALGLEAGVAAETARAATTKI